MTRLDCRWLSGPVLFDGAFMQTWTQWPRGAVNGPQAERLTVQFVGALLQQ